MSELDILNLARSTTEHQVAWFAQMLTINFAMVVAIYYFLNAAKLPLKLFSFFAYTVGMLVLLGQMLAEANVKVGALEAPQSHPCVWTIAAQRSLSGSERFLDPPSRQESLLIFPFWLLWFGILYLLFFSGRHWKARHDHEAADPPAARNR